MRRSGEFGIRIQKVIWQDGKRSTNNNWLLAIRWIVGLLFIFSGLIKANDPLGLSYKMQEFFEVWNMHVFNDYTLALSLIMNVFEVLAGVAVIIGWRMKLFSWLLLVLIIFFTFLTGYALFSGKIKTCGCFGDCLPLSSLQSFIKDIVLLVFILVLFIYNKKIYTNLKTSFALLILLITVLLISVLQGYVLKNLPLIDCLPYKKDNNLIEQMKVPAGALQDSVVMTFKYAKAGKTYEFSMDELPEDLDTYEFIDRYDKVVRKGNAIAPITDFTLMSFEGNDVTEAILSQPQYVMVFAKDFSTIDKWNNEAFESFKNNALQSGVPVYLVTADKQNATRYFGQDDQIKIILCDATVIKTAARVNPTIFLMKEATVIGKYSYTQLKAADVHLQGWE